MTTFEPLVGVDKTDVSRLSLSKIFLILYSTAFVLCMLDLVDGLLYLGDIDDSMRASQIRAFMLPGGRWWDLTLPSINLPQPYVSPWSRLVDLPYILLASALKPLIGQEIAFSLAFNIWPPVLLAVYCFFAASVCRRFAPPSSLIGILLLVATSILMVLSIWEFAPGRIDHHNVQLVALSAVFAGLSRWDRCGGVLIGTGSVVSVAVALEGIPFVAMAFASLFICVLARDRLALLVLHAASLSMLVLTLPLAFVLIGPAGIKSTQCDAFSAPYILLLVGCATILGGLSPLVARHKGWLVPMLLSGAAFIMLFICLFPDCLSGPYWMIDPVSKNYWFDRIPQEASSLYFIQESQFNNIAFEALMAAVLILSAPPVFREFKAGRNALLAMWGFAALSLLLTVFMGRYLRFAFAFIPLLLPVAMSYSRNACFQYSRFANLGVMISTGFVLAVIVLAVAVAPRREVILDAATFMSFDACKRASFGALSTVPAGKIVAPEGLAMTLLPSLPSGFSVAAVPFHRASPGMKRVFEAFLSSDPAIRLAALAPFDYVAACRFPIKPDIGTAPLYDALSAGQDWPGLIRLPTGADNPFQLFRIDHATLQ
ncbi:hypothetical protein [Neorhizobium sp. JUb45]|uniref:hypothetical protein n=1 Tax=unclassified Neorhizobium TaxID=2629175 RepID=UPI00104C5E00|nr:hypothetical protein [Neorhizobium sp. JUb45]TCR06997.1 hypothetical protein EDF70_101961 [Neorhizobium sp. JUb45]